MGALGGLAVPAVVRTHTRIPLVLTPSPTCTPPTIDHPCSVMAMQQASRLAVEIENEAAEAAIDAHLAAEQLAAFMSEAADRAVLSAYNLEAAEFMLQRAVQVNASSAADCWTCDIDGGGRKSLEQLAAEKDAANQNKALFSAWRSQPNPSCSGAGGASGSGAGASCSGAAGASSSQLMHWGLCGESG